MKNILLIGLLALAGAFPAKAQDTDSDFYQLKMTSLDGKEVDFSEFRGKKVLLVNTASKCGFTPQYEDLEALYKQYKDQGVVVLGFPSGDFMNQELKSSEEIAAFCKKNYGVTFPLFEKSSVKGEEKNPVFDWLTDKDRNGWNTEEPSWNFCKYLVDENGKLVAFYPSKVKPLSQDILSKL